VGIRTNGGSWNVYNTTMLAWTGWSQLIVSAEKHGIGAAANQKTKLTMRIYNKNNQNSSPL